MEKPYIAQELEDIICIRNNYVTGESLRTFLKKTKKEDRIKIIFRTDVEIEKINRILMVENETEVFFADNIKFKKKSSQNFFTEISILEEGIKIIFTLDGIKILRTSEFDAVSLEEKFECFNILLQKLNIEFARKIKIFETFYVFNDNWILFNDSKQFFLKVINFERNIEETLEKSELFFCNCEDFLNFISYAGIKGMPLENSIFLEEGKKRIVYNNGEFFYCGKRIEGFYHTFLEIEEIIDKILEKDLTKQ